MKSRCLLVIVAVLLPVSHAIAQYSWCCTNVQHAGGSAADRCTGTKLVVATKAECEAAKEKHDKATGHRSICQR